MSAVGRRTGRLALAVAVLLGSGALAVGPGLAQTTEREKRVLLSTTGNDSERLTTVPITRGGGKEPRSVMSMEPAELPSLHRGDRLEITSETEITTDCLKHTRRCVGSPYRYDPELGARLVLASAPGQTVAGTRAISRRKDLRCRQVLPNREHHCMIVFTNPEIKLTDPGSMPCPLQACYVNLVVDAHSPKAGPGDVVLVGADEPNGSVEQDKGRINAIRSRRVASSGGPLAPPPPEAEVLATSERKKTQLKVGSDRTVIYSQRIQQPRGGEQFAVEANWIADISRLRNNVRLGSRLLLTRFPDAARAGRAVKQVATLDGEVSEGNGFNCTHATDPCETKKVGVVKLKDEPRNEDGRRIDLYLNLVVATDPLGPEGDRRRVRVLPGGRLKVVRYPRAMKG